MTYDAFAARLVAEHGLRLGFEADPTMITGATRYRLASRVVKAAAGPFEFISRLRPATVTERVLRLDADLQQHLVDPAELDHARPRPAGRAGVGAAEQPRRQRLRRREAGHRRRPGATGAGQPGAGLPGAQGSGSGWSSSPTRWPSRPGWPPQVPAGLRPRSGRRSGWCCWTSTRTPRPPRRSCCAGCSPARTPSDGLGHPVTAVGDPFQAIYGWRGAAASNITCLRRRASAGADGRPAARLRAHRQPAQRAAPSWTWPTCSARPLRADASLGRLGAGEPHGLGLLEAPPETPPAARSGPRPSTPGPRRSRWIGDQVVACTRDRPGRRAGPTSPC